MHCNCRRWALSLVFFGSLALVSACSSGGGGGGGGGLEFISISVEGGEEVRYTLTKSASAPYGYSPDVYSISSQPESAHIYCLEWTGSAYVSRFQADISDYAGGIHTGSYRISDIGNYVQFTPQGGTAYNTLSTGNSGTITITAVGGDGEIISGTFDVITAVNSVLTSTARLTGSFSVARYLAY